MLLLQQKDFWVLQVSRSIRKRTYHLYGCNVFKCKSFAFPDAIAVKPTVKAAALALKRLLKAVFGFLLDIHIYIFVFFIVGENSNILMNVKVVYCHAFISGGLPTGSWCGRYFLHSLGPGSPLAPLQTTIFQCMYEISVTSFHDFCLSFSKK